MKIYLKSLFVIFLFLIYFLLKNAGVFVEVADNVLLIILKHSKIFIVSILIGLGIILNYFIENICKNVNKMQDYNIYEELTDVEQNKINGYADLIWTNLEENRRSIVIVNGVHGSGKTTVINTLINKQKDNIKKYKVVSTWKTEFSGDKITYLFNELINPKIKPSMYYWIITILITSNFVGIFDGSGALFALILLLFIYLGKTNLLLLLSKINNIPVSFFMKTLFLEVARNNEVIVIEDLDRLSNEEQSQVIEFIDQLANCENIKLIISLTQSHLDEEVLRDLQKLEANSVIKYVDVKLKIENMDNTRIVAKNYADVDLAAHMIHLMEKHDRLGFTFDYRMYKSFIKFAENISFSSFEKITYFDIMIMHMLDYKFSLIGNDSNYYFGNERVSILIKEILTESFAFLSINGVSEILGLKIKYSLDKPHYIGNMQLYIKPWILGMEMLLEVENTEGIVKMEPHIITPKIYPIMDLKEKFLDLGIINGNSIIDNIFQMLMWSYIIEQQFENGDEFDDYRNSTYTDDSKKIFDYEIDMSKFDVINQNLNLKFESFITNDQKEKVVENLKFAAQKFECKEPTGGDLNYGFYRNIETNEGFGVFNTWNFSNHLDRVVDNTSAKVCMNNVIAGKLYSNYAIYKISLYIIQNPKLERYVHPESKIIELKNYLMDNLSESERSKIKSFISHYAYFSNGKVNIEKLVNELFDFSELTTKM